MGWFTKKEPEPAPDRRTVKKLKQLEKQKEKQRLWEEEDEMAIMEEEEEL